MTTPTPAPDFFNCQVTVVEIDGKNTFQYNPPKLVVKKKDCIINFQLVNSPGWKLTGISHTPENTRQFSAPSISQSGDMITFNDANTMPNEYKFTLELNDNGSHPHFSDPEVINQPE